MNGQERLRDSVDLAHAYAEMASIVQHLRGDRGNRVPLEPFESVSAAHEHRLAWIPKRVRVLLLAESHVFTGAEDVRARVVLRTIHGAPSSFVRLVYCIGYGEPDVVRGSLAENTGTPQYWKLLAASVRDPRVPGFCADVLKTTNRSTMERVRAKAQLLVDLRRAGVWLLDVSPIALYGGAGKPNGSQIARLVKAGWELYARPIVDALGPKRIVVIGTTVHRVLVREIARTGVSRVRWIYQPQARVSTTDHARGLELIHAECS